jgi:hypothetical protein
MTSHPSIYVISVALYAAAREQNGDPGQIALDAASGAQDDQRLGRSEPRPLNQTRSYACIALRRHFPSAGKKWLARSVGSRVSPDVWVSKLIRDVVQQTYRRCWNEEALDRVSAAVEWAIEIEAKKSGAVDVVPCAPVVRPAVSERQRAAARMLEEAVRNTAALTKNGADVR